MNTNVLDKGTRFKLMLIRSIIISKNKRINIIKNLTKKEMIDILEVTNNHNISLLFYQYNKDTLISCFENSNIFLLNYIHESIITKPFLDSVNLDYNFLLLSIYDETISIKINPQILKKIVSLKKDYLISIIKEFNIYPSDINRVDKEIRSILTLDNTKYVEKDKNIKVKRR